jgi:hypothetical protein
VKTDRFAKRRLVLQRRHKCTRCGTATPKPGCRTCPDCLAIAAQKRAIQSAPITRARERARIERARLLIRAALDRIEAEHNA